MFARPLAKLRRRHLAGESGMTIVELSVSMLLLGIVTSAVIGVLLSVQTSFGKEIDRSGANDQARLAVQGLDREIRSGNLLYAPTDGGMNLIVYTQTNATTRNPGNRCVQWRISGTFLERRDWRTDWRDSGGVSDWRVVAEHVVNRAPPETPSTPVPAFVLDTSQASYGNRIMKVTILSNENASTGKSVRITSSVTARNTEFGYPNEICADVPAA